MILKQSNLSRLIDVAKDVITMISSIIFLLYPIVGIYQMVTAFYRYYCVKGFAAEYYYKLENYLMSVIAYFVVFFIIWHVFDMEKQHLHLNEEITIFYTFIPPLGLAFYYWKIRKYKKVK